MTLDDDDQQIASPRKQRKTSSQLHQQKPRASCDAQTPSASHSNTASGKRCASREPANTVSQSLPHESLPDEITTVRQRNPPVLNSTKEEDTVFEVGRNSVDEGKVRARHTNRKLSAARKEQSNAPNGMINGDLKRGEASKPTKLQPLKVDQIKV
ncbi:unnamed protein product [Anisakis simplex]|uniref:Shugoshin_C domain-containing protein n=1 Tax=Anisakis simplex TaxID=6269 RepID=A0A0M3KF15_ANISI|nr:unnamed protein product [Anisakis simplex]